MYKNLLASGLESTTILQMKPDSQDGAGPDQEPEPEAFETAVHDGTEVDQDGDLQNYTAWDDASFTLEQLKADDCFAWTELTKTFTRIAENYIRKSFTNPGDLQPLTFQDAEDITLKIILDLYKRITAKQNPIKDLGHLKASFRQALKNRTIDCKRGMNTQSRGGGFVQSAADPELRPGKKMTPIEADYKARVEPFTNDALITEDENSVEDIQNALAKTDIEYSDLKKLLFDCATELGPEERKLIGYVYDNIGQSEIATLMSINVKNVTEISKRIYKKLQPKLLARLGKQELEDYGLKKI